ncbi:hypothetical protein D3C87_1766980 [compost metagenome]
MPMVSCTMMKQNYIFVMQNISIQNIKVQMARRIFGRGEMVGFLPVMPKLFRICQKRLNTEMNTSAVLRKWLKRLQLPNKKKGTGQEVFWILNMHRDRKPAVQHFLPMALCGELTMEF